MKHSIALSGQMFRLRPVDVDDARYILKLRTDPRLDRFIGETSSRVEDQIDWIERYLKRPGDWYFIIERVASGRPEGTIGLYNYDTKAMRAEWGRWLLEPGSMGAVESALLIYRVAFEVLNLETIYCRTVLGNRTVVSFHDSSGAQRAALVPNFATIRGDSVDAVEHCVDALRWSTMEPKLAALSARIAAIQHRTA